MIFRALIGRLLGYPTLAGARWRPRADARALRWLPRPPRLRHPAQSRERQARHQDVAAQDHAEQPRVVAVDSAGVVVGVEGALVQDDAGVGGVACAREIGEPDEAGRAAAAARRLAARLELPERGALAREGAPEPERPAPGSRLRAGHGVEAVALGERDGAVEARDVGAYLSRFTPLGVGGIGEGEERAGGGVAGERVGGALEASRGDEPCRERGVG